MNGIIVYLHFRMNFEVPEKASKFVVFLEKKFVSAGGNM